MLAQSTRRDLRKPNHRKAALLTEAENQMGWEHTEALKLGDLKLMIDNAGHPDRAAFVLDSVSTGRTRVFHGYQLSVYFNEKVYNGSNPRSLRDAVLDCASKLREDGLRMSIAAVADGFGESGLSYNTGWGFLPGKVQAVHMMEFCELPNAS